MSASNTNGLGFAGLATGIDTAKLVEGLTRINQRRIDALTERKTAITTRQTAFATLQGKLFDLQFKTNALARSAGSAFDGRIATTSDDTAVTAVAGTAAVPGTYSLTVNSLANAAQVASGGFADPNATLKTGTLSIQVGSGAATTVTLDSRNNTLQGLADAVNAAGGEVRASIINDGSSAPYRLLLTSAKTGAANAITVTNNLTDGTGADIDPTARVVQAATDASVTVGGGAGALTVTSSTNQMNKLIPGVSLTLQRADPAKPVNLTVANDTAGTVKAVKEFVDTFNDIRDFLAEQTKFDPETRAAGVLQGNRDAAAVGDELSAALTATVPGLNPNVNRLSAVGLSLNEKGKLTFDQSKLTAVLNGQGGVTPADVKKLFAVSGSSDSPGVEFVLGTPRTKPSGSTPFQVNVTSPATRAVVVSSGPPAPSVIISPPNNALQLRVNGLLSGGVTLNPGTYTPESLVQMLQQRINATPALDGNSVSVGLDSGGRIQIASQQFGGSSSVELVDGTALTALGFTAGQRSVGTNVAGNFVVNGVTEAATGSGQVLSGRSGNANTDGLQVRAALPAPGSANLTVGLGLAGRVNAVLNKYLDANTGRLKAVTDTFRQQTADIDKTITRQNDFLRSKTADLEAQFAAMEAAVNQLKGVQGQLASLVIPTSSNR
ncbi:MAG: flagellar filament capping protein FliD [Fimbriiglobus sp.]|nr:flagellar filament capping protein FliD [Fimbriiglobus sp.]